MVFSFFLKTSICVFFGLEVFCSVFVGLLHFDCYLEGVFAFVENFLDGCDGHVAGIVSLGKNDENLLGDNFETISFYFMFCDMMVTVACSNFCHFGKQVGVNSEKTFKRIVLIKYLL